MVDFMSSGTIQAMEMFKILKASAVLESYTQRRLTRPAAIRGREKEAVATAALEGERKTHAS